MKRLNRKTIQTLRKVQRHILEEPKRLAMGLWCWEQGGDFPIALKVYGNAWNNYNEYEAKQIPECGTVACIAGWLEKFGLGLEGRNTFYPLISVKKWPKGLRKEYRTAKSPAKRARLAARAIDEFIQQDGVWA